MWRMLTNIAKTHQRKLLVTLGLVGAENLLLMIYPVFGGWVINAVIDGNIFQSLMYGLVVLLMWMIGALRRAVDTRTFTKIYTQIAVPVVLEQREKQILHSAITARVALSREFVNFFEEHLPIAATSIASILGACVMLLVLEFWAGVLALIILAFFSWLLPSFVAMSESLYFRLNNRLEKDNYFIKDGKSNQLWRHYDLMARFRILISNREAIGYLAVGIAMSILFGFAFSWMAIQGNVNAGHIYSVSTYLWMFAMSLDDIPRLVEQYSNLKDISERVNLVKE